METPPVTGGHTRLTVLVNGEVPLRAPGAQAPMCSVPGNKITRLRLLNEAIARNFYIKLLDASGNQINLLASAARADC